MKKFLVSFITMMTMILGISCYVRFVDPIPEGTLARRTQEIAYNQVPAKPEPPKEEVPATEVDPTVPVEPVPEAPKELHKAIRIINERNKNIKSFSCSDVEIKVWELKKKNKLSGKIFSEKPDNFQMQISSIMGVETEIGSNHDYFWYWSRRDAHPGLHYATYENLSKTRLKTPFNPVFLRSTLGIEEIQVENAKIVENDDDLLVSKPEIDGMGRSVTFSIFVSKKHERIDGYLVINPADGKILASCEIQGHSNGLPVKILYSWYEEKCFMMLTLKKPRLNVEIDRKIWEMPAYQPKLDMTLD